MKHLLIIVLTTLVLASCKKDAELPSLTSTGAQTLGCKINGKSFVASGNTKNLSPGGISGYRITTEPWPMITIIAVQEDPRYQINITFNFKDTVGRYELAEAGPYEGIFKDLSGSSTAVTGQNEYKTTNSHVGHVIVTHYSGKII